MSYVSTQDTSHSTLFQTVLSKLGGIKSQISQRRSYRQTIRALSQLSDHELADLGMNRHSVHSDAWQAVYGANRRV